MKLSNVLVTSNLDIKLADFGLAEESNQLSNMQAGTPMTMAPEVLNNGKIDYKCDVWSFGCMIY